MVRNTALEDFSDLLRKDELTLQPVSLGVPHGSQASLEGWYRILRGIRQCVPEENMRWV